MVEAVNDCGREYAGFVDFCGTVKLGEAGFPAGDPAEEEGTLGGETAKGSTEEGIEIGSGEVLSKDSAGDRPEEGMMELVCRGISLSPELMKPQLRDISFSFCINS